MCAHDRKAVKVSWNCITTMFIATFSMLQGIPCLNVFMS